MLAAQDREGRAVLAELTGQKLLAGWTEGSSSLRVTTRLVRVDAIRGVVVTSSGRQYQLIGEPLAANDARDAIVELRFATMGLLDALVDRSEDILRGL